MKDILLYWPRFFSEMRTSYKFYKGANQIKDQLNEIGVRVDWIGRLYTVLNLKDEALQQPELVQQSMIFQSLSPINEVLLKNGLSDFSFPEISKISNRSYLVVLYPENDNFNIYSFLRNVLFAISFGLIVYGIVEAVKYFV